jgi:peptide/nickel transport system permease protein
MTAFLRREPLLAAAAGITGLFALTALLAATGLLPWDPVARLGASHLPPDGRFWLGTDFLGRDVFARVLHGARTSFVVGLVASAIAIPIGVALGAAAGYFGGWIDRAVVWLFTVVTSVPQILLLTSLSFVLGRGLGAIYAAVGLTSWVGICRLIRAEVARIKSADYVAAARALGAGRERLLTRHILPNAAHLVVVDFSLRFVYAIKSEAILSYLGLGAQGEPSWGVMIADARLELVRGVWWQLAGATGAMFLLVLALNLLGDHLRDRFDPRTAEG